MIDRKQFEQIKEKHGGYASWAVWVAQGGTPTSNVGDMSVFDLDSNASLLQKLKNNVVMVGLNISRPFCEYFRNFHDPRPAAKDFKIRFAFEETLYYGAYMTDIIKNFVEPSSKNILRTLKDNPKIIEESLETFREELRDLKSSAPLIFAFGDVAHRIITKKIRRTEYSRLIKLTHYSDFGGKEKYREKVRVQISQALAQDI